VHFTFRGVEEGGKRIERSSVQVRAELVSWSGWSESESETKEWLEAWWILCGGCR
jgi:hypothetical protein